MEIVQFIYILFYLDLPAILEDVELIELNREK
jgi:hypothetical protein